MSLYERWAAEARDAGWEPASGRRGGASVAHRLGAPPHTEPSGPRRRGAGCVSSGRRSPAATSSKRSSAMLIPPSASDASSVRAMVERDRRRGAGRPDGGVFASTRTQSKLPATLVRRDGGSVWDPPQAGRYTTREMLAVEGRILHAAQLGRSRRRRARHAPRPSTVPSRLKHSPRYRPARRTTGHHEPGATARSRDRSRRQRQDHHAARRDPSLGNAGYQVIGLTHTAVAADVLRSEAGMPAETVAKFFDWHDHQPPAGWALTPRHVVVVDEAGMLATRDLDRLVDLVTRAGAKVVLVGDHQQLGAIRAPGGMFAALAETLGAIELHEAHRFAHRWEAHALAELRRGDPAGLEALARHRRVHGGPQPQAQRDCLAGWWAAHHTGHDTIMLAHDHTTAHQLATQARAARVVAGEVQAHGIRVHTDVEDQTISVGDHIETRRNDRRLTYGPDQWVHNHDRWHVVAIDQHRGTLEVEHLRHGARITLPADYVAHHVRLAYATTIAAAQGLTVDETHVVVTPGMYRSELYTALSRGRDANHAYAICETDTELTHQPRRNTTNTDRGPRPSDSTRTTRLGRPQRPPAHDEPRRTTRSDQRPNARSHANPATRARRIRSRRPRHLPPPARSPRPRNRAATNTSHQATSADPRALAAPARAKHRTLTLVFTQLA